MKHTNNLLIAGAGRIGFTIANILALNPNNRVTLIDAAKPTHFEIHHKSIIFTIKNVSHSNELENFIKENHFNAIISCLPFMLNKLVAEIAKENHCHYFDVTEDVDTTNYIFSLSKNADTAFIPQCGVAPGLINIIANDLIQKVLQEKHHLPNTVKMYCGALPINSTNALGYALNWSTAGLVNEYANSSRVLENSKIHDVSALTGLEKVLIKNIEYEAFNTSGGAGTLIDTYNAKINEMFYKTLRFPGHCEKMDFLLNGLKLKNNQQILIEILENALPKNQPDFVITHVIVDDNSETKIFHPAKIANINCSAIQAVTSASAAAVINTVLNSPNQYKGPQKQESFSVKNIIENDLTGYLKC